ncbi:hypothetical protein FO519_004288 [Halicephalobus sp. NKZ332]|nr:hypothetical protein FO519_004288 [Halicephalobus sp. NKZ332]
MRFTYSERTKQLCLQVANYSGLIYSGLAIFGITVLSLNHVCPTIYGEGQCGQANINAVIILCEIVVNLALFTYYNSRNQVSYWTVKSSSLLFEDSEKIAQFGKILTEREMMENERRPERQALIMDSRSSESLQNPPAPFARLDYRDPILGRYDDEAVEVSPQDTPTTKYCSQCNTITPRRCHHCPLCKICVLRKDHHCFLTGGCVGLANQRYFIVFLFWASLGAFYGCSYLFTYLNTFVTPWFPLGWLTYVGPISIVRWIFGYESAFNMMIAVVFSMAFSSGFGALGFFGFQIFYTLEGYTMHDYHVGRLKDHLESDGENCIFTASSRLLGMLALTVAIVHDGDGHLKEARSLLGYRKTVDLHKPSDPKKESRSLNSVNGNNFKNMGSTNIEFA